MPRYLCKDYLSEALQQCRSQLEAMLVPPPYHIEFVNQYVHKGEAAEPHLSLEHILENTLDYSHLPCISCTDDIIHNNLVALKKHGDWTDCLSKGTEDYNPSTHTEETADISPLSQDISSAMERFIPSSNDLSVSGDSGGGEGSGERFLPATLLTEQLQVDEGCGGHYLEEMEPHLHLAGLLQLLPTVEDMAARLRPKMLQDPLLDAEGRPYSYFRICSADFSLDTTNTTKSPVLLAKSETNNHLQESFIPDNLVQEIDGQEVDPFLELPIAEEEEEEGEGLGHVSLEAEGVVKSVLAEPEGVNAESGDADQEMGFNSTTSELETLVDQCKDTAALTKLETTPADCSTPDHTDFATLLNQGSGANSSTDSGIGHALLESPFIPPPPSSSLPALTSTPYLRHQLGQLHPLPLSPHAQEEMNFLSPVAKKKRMKEIWEKEKLFDTVLALTIPPPDIDGEIGEELTVEDVIVKLSIQPLKFDGNNELELSWDPLDASYRTMDMASRSLHPNQPTFNCSDPTSTTQDSYDAVKEGFVSDSCGVGGGERERALSPVCCVEVCGVVCAGVGSGAGEVVGVVREEGQEQSDVPDLHLQPVAPKGYLKPSVPPNMAPPTQSRLDPWGVVQQASSIRRGREHSGRQVDGFFGHSPRPSIKCKASASFVSPLEGVSALDAFLMLRTGVASDKVVAGGRKRTRPRSPVEETEKRPALCDGSVAISQEKMETVTSPTFQDVCLSGSYLAAVSRIESLLVSLRGQLEGCGLHLPMRGAWPRELSIDSLKFFMKQQQKALQDNQALGNKSGEGERSCQLSACLYVTGSVLDTFTHCSLKTALSHLLSLLEKYSHLHQEGVQSLKTILLELETDQTFPPHPKLAELVRIVSRWKKEARRSSRDKVVVVVAREFTVLSGEILDYLQYIPGLESCVFSLTSCDGSNQLYKNAVEERFHHYDCLVVPISALSDHSCFLWEKVSLLLEYEPLRTPLFGGGAGGEGGEGEVGVLERLHLHQYITLRTVFDLATSNISFTTADSGSHYVVVASDNVTSDPQLLQLLETRYNILVVERDYSSLTPSKWLSWADICVSPGVAILLRPFCTLASSEGGSGLINTVTGMSLQYQTCWIILYQQDQKSYELGGSVPHQLSLLHASVSSLHPHYHVQVLLASSTAHAAQLVRRIAEEAHRVDKDRTGEEWDDRSWLSEEMTQKEKFLLCFPCINSFSAQFMLRKFTLSALLTADLSLLKDSLPGIAERSLTLFHSMCHVSTVADTGYSGSSPNAPSLPEQASEQPVPYETKQVATWSEAGPGRNYHSKDDRQNIFLAPCTEDQYHRNQLSNYPLYSACNTTSTAAGKGPPSDDIVNVHQYIDAPVSSTIPGLNDSLEYMDSEDVPPFLAHSNEGNEPDAVSSFFHGDLESWMKPAQLPIPTSDRGFAYTTSQFSHPPTSQDWFARQRSPISHPARPDHQDLRHDPPRTSTKEPSFSFMDTGDFHAPTVQDGRSVASKSSDCGSFFSQDPPSTLGTHDFLSRFSANPKSFGQGTLESHPSSVIGTHNPLSRFPGQGASESSMFDAHDSLSRFPGHRTSESQLFSSIGASDPLSRISDHRVPATIAAPVSLGQRPSISSFSHPSSLVNTTTSFRSKNCFLPIGSSVVSAKPISSIDANMARGLDHPRTVSSSLFSSSLDDVSNNTSNFPPFSSNSNVKNVSAISELMGGQPTKNQAESTTIDSYLNSHQQNPPPPPVTTSSLFDNGHLVPRSSKAISSMVVRKPRELSKPVKALDLGIDSSRDRNVKLRSNDRILAQPSVGGAEGGGGGGDVGGRMGGEVVRSKYFPVDLRAGAGSGQGVLGSKGLRQNEGVMGSQPAVSSFFQQHEI